VLRNAVPFDDPVPFHGRLGFFKPTIDTNLIRFFDAPANEANRDA
jgi:hypothetical protein